jgi:ASPM-SPD-2-Hydin domain-containing protein
MVCPSVLGTKRMRRLSLSIFAALAVVLLNSCGGGSTLTEPPPAPAIAFSPATVYFPSQSIGTASAAQMVTVTNTGNAPLSITGLSLNGPNAAEFTPSNNCLTEVAPGGSCFIGVTFTPAGGGLRVAAISVADNVNGSPHYIELSGQGVPANLRKLSTDTFTNTTSQHATEVEPDIAAFGSTIVAVFQVGRFFNGGSSAIGFATSTDAGATWTSGFLPGITKIQDPANLYDRVSDPSVAFDAAHLVWLAATLPLNATASGTPAPAILVSASTDGVNWGDPIIVGTGTDLDKNWITCDNWPASPFFGHCYVEWDAPSSSDLVFMSTSSDGGLTWGSALTTANHVSGIGGIPVVEPSGTVVVPLADDREANILAFSSTDGGATWSGTTTVSSIIDHIVAGSLRSGPLPSAAVDELGTVYVVWQDCRFTTGCSANDIVMSTSPDGLTWSSPVRIPIDPVASGVDHFIPGLGVDPATSGGTAHLGLTYHFYPQSSCTVSTCQLNVGFTSSTDGGTTWSAPAVLAGPMALSDLASTNQGAMVGDYISTAFASGLAHSAFAVAFPKMNGIFDEAIYTTPSGLSQARTAVAFLPVVKTPVLSFASDHPPRTTPAKIR